MLLPAHLLCQVASQASRPPGRPSGHRRRSGTAVRPRAPLRPSSSTPRAFACARPRLPVWEATVPSLYGQLLAAVPAALPSQDHNSRGALGPPRRPTLLRSPNLSAVPREEEAELAEGPAWPSLQTRPDAAPKRHREGRGNVWSLQIPHRSLFWPAARCDVWLQSPGLLAASARGLLTGSLCEDPSVHA